MITVLGGALINLVPTADETVLRAFPGGSALNIATATARQGFPVALMARLSRDPFGQMLRRYARQSGVDLSAAPEADEPTTIAVVPAGSAQRHGGRWERDGSIYVERTAWRQWTSAELEWMPSATTVVHVGSVTHWPGPVLMRILRAAARFQQRGAMLVIGPGARPSAAAALMETPGENRILFDRAVRSADVIQASVDDIAWLYPGKAPEAVAESWLHTGPDLLVIIRGPGSAVALREPGIAVHRPSRRAANANGEDGSGANAAEAFTAGLLGALYRLRQRKLALRELNAEGLTAILDTALHAPAGTSINSLLPVVPEYFRFINTAKLTLPLSLSRGPRGPANQVRRTCRAGAGAARRKGETDASPRSSCTCVQVVRHRHGRHRCFLVSRHSRRPGWRQHRQRGSGPCEVCGHHLSQGPSHAHNAVRRPLQAARAAALDNQFPVCRGGRALHARRPEPDRATGAQRPAHRGGTGERQHPVPRRHEHDV